MIKNGEFLTTKNSYQVKSKMSIVMMIRNSLSTITFEQLLVYSMALFISRASMMEGITPFGIALVTTYLLRHKQGVIIAIMASLGVISFHGYNGYGYIITIWTILFIYKMLSNRIKMTTFNLALLSALTLFVVKGAILYLGDFYLYDSVMTGFEGIIVFSLTYIFNYSLGLIEGVHDRPYTSEELVCGAITLALTVLGFGGLTLFSIGIKSVISILLVIFFAYLKGPTMGAAVGVTIGLVTGMSQANMPLILAIYGFSGLLSGLFKDLGKVGSCLGFLVGNGIMSFYINGFTVPIIHIKEVLIAVGMFFILINLLKKIKPEVMTIIGNGVFAEEAYKNRIKEITFKRLREVSGVFEELAGTLQRVADKKKIVEHRDISKFIDTIVDDTCKQCPMYRFCWANDFYSTYYAMFDVMSTIEAEGTITENNLSETLKKRCIKPKTIVDKINYLFDIYKLNYMWENKLVESRQLVSEQLEGVSKIIDDLATEIYDDVLFKEDAEKIIYSELKNNGIDVKEVIVTQNDSGKFEIILEIKACGERDQCIDTIAPLLSNVMGLELVRDRFTCSLPKSKGRCRVKLIRSNRYGVVTKTCKASNSLNYISGDNYTFGEKDNHYYVALSDGMGIGEKANQESDITISLLEKFLEAGFDKELALKTINSILVLKSNEEMLTTMDMAVIDLFGGSSQFIKIGAAPTFIKKKNKVEVIDSNTLPLGILKDVDFQVYQGELNDGDMIIMMSDGVLDANMEAEDKTQWMIDIVSEIKSVNPQTVADKIIEKAGQICNNDIKDDMTVLVTKVWKRRGLKKAIEN